MIGRLAPNLGVLMLGADNVSRDPVVVKDYENDPLNHNGKVRARTGAEMLPPCSASWTACPRITVPVHRDARQRRQAGARRGLAG